jgi:hypothetical protein
MKLNIVPADTGMTWVKLGIQTFIKQPLALGALAAFSLLLFSGVFYGVLYIGVAVGLMLLPFIQLGLLVATLEVWQGNRVQPGHLLTAFRAEPQRLRAMLLLGALYACAVLLLTGLTLFIDGGEFATTFLTGEPPKPDVLGASNFLWARLFHLVMSIPLLLMLWHAPALVYWHNISPLKAMFFSLIACVRNIGAYAIFALACFGMLLIPGLMFMSLLSALGLQDSVISVLFLGYGFLLGLIIMNAIYFTFRDSFIHLEPPEAEPDVVE